MKIGTHIPKNRQFFNSLQDFYDKEENIGKPSQIFTGSPKFWKRPTISLQDADDTKNYVKEHNLSVYIHSIYLINLCRSPEEFNEKAFHCLKWELDIGAKLGVKGVDVHCGKSLITLVKKF